MIYEAVNYLKSKGYSIATLGTSPLGNIVETDNPDHKRVNEALHLIYEHPNGFYNFKTLHEFKDSFNPTHMEDKFICFYPPKLKIRIILAIIKAYNPTGISDMLFSKLKKVMEKFGD
jgi:phosphatidylglycerol lysyltransferase